MTRGSRFRFGGVALAALLGTAGLVTAGAPVTASADAAKPSKSELKAISAFYGAKEFDTARSMKQTARTSRSEAAGASAGVGDDYFDSFRAAYASDPSIRVLSMDVGQKVLKTTKTAQGSQLTVSVTVSFQLKDVTDGSVFSGGETTDHVVTTVAPAGGAVSVVSDVNTGLSTASAALVAETAADVAAVNRVTGPVPAWQLGTKSQSAAPQAAASTAEDSKAAGSEAATSEAAAGQVSAQAANPYPQLNYQAVANYASVWTDSSHDDKLNDKYGDSGDNCTNFISQALHVGGWPNRDTTYPYRANLDYWDWNMTGPGKFTYSWSRAEQSYRMIHDKAGKSTFGDLENAFLADVVYFDWNVGGSTYGDGVKDHAMIVSKRTKAHPYFSQKSGNRHNVPPSTVIKNIKAAGGTKWKVFGLRT